MLLFPTPWKLSLLQCLAQMARNFSSDFIEEVPTEASLSLPCMT